jgi:hypothetical protein
MDAAPPHATGAARSGDAARAPRGRARSVGPEGADGNDQAAARAAARRRLEEPPPIFGARPRARALPAGGRAVPRRRCVMRLRALG